MKITHLIAALRLRLYCLVISTVFSVSVIMWCFKAETAANQICHRPALFVYFFLEFVHHPYPMVEVLMFPASGVGLEADGC